MKSWKRFVLSLTAFAWIGLVSNEVNGEAFNGCCNQKISIGADFIYWKPCIDDIDVVAEVQQTETRGTHVNYKKLCLDWEPGFRVYLNLPDTFCDWGIWTSYTYLKSTDSLDQEVCHPEEGNFLGSPLLLAPTTIYLFGEQDWALRYQEWEAVAYYNLLCGKCARFFPYIGVAGIYLDQKLQAEFSGPSSVKMFDSENEIEIAVVQNVKWDSESWGAGLRLGAYYEYRLCSNFSIFANGNMSLLAGKTCSQNDQRLIITDEVKEETRTTDFYSKDGKKCAFVPGYHIAAGVKYEACWCSVKFGARLGYEFVYWHHLPNQRVFDPNPIPSSNFNSMAVPVNPEPVQLGFSTSPSARTVGFHGLIAGLYVTF